jgi:hypothetical protein
MCGDAKKRKSVKRRSLQVNVLISEFCSRRQPSNNIRNKRIYFILLVFKTSATVSLLLQGFHIRLFKTSLVPRRVEMPRNGRV